MRVTPPNGGRNVQRWVLGAALLWLVGACGGAQRTPVDTLHYLGRALRDGAYDTVYEGLSADFRARVRYPDFVRFMEEHDADRQRIASELLQAHETLEPTRAYVESSSRERLELVLEDDEWRMVASTLQLYDQSSPRSTVQTFVRAMERHRYDIVLGLVPNADRENMTVEQLQTAFEGAEREEIARMLASLRENLNAPIEIVGNRASMPYGAGSVFQMLFEDNVWRVEDPD